MNNIQSKFEDALDWGDNDTVFEILSKYPEIELTSFDLFCAIEDKNTELVKYILENTDINPSDSYNKAILWAAKNGDYDTFKILFEDKRVNPYDQDNVIFVALVDNNCIPILNLLIEDKGKYAKYRYPNERNNLAIKMAFNYEKHEIVKILWKNKEVKKTLKIDHQNIYNVLMQENIQAF